MDKIFKGFSEKEISEFYANFQKENIATVKYRNEILSIKELK